MAALQYLDSLRSAHPELSEWYNSLADLYQRKLWHQLTQKLEQFVALAAGDALIQLYHNFITDFETKINLLKLAQFAVIVSRQCPEKEAAITYLEGVIVKIRATKEARIEEPILYIKMQIAILKLEQGNQKECKNLLEDGKTTLDSMADIDPSVYASFYWISSQYYKSLQEFGDFYKSALLYLAYTSVESLSESFKLDLAFDLSLSALLGDNVHTIDISTMAALQYLDSLRSAHPELSEWYNSLADLYQRKLWHQLTQKLEQFVALASGDALIQLYHNFITDFETKINLLKLAQFAVIVSRQYPEKEAAITYLEGVIEKIRATKAVRIEPIL